MVSYDINAPDYVMQISRRHLMEWCEILCALARVQAVIHQFISAKLHVVQVIEN